MDINHLLVNKHFKNKTEEEDNNSIDYSHTENKDYVNNLNVKRIKIRMMNTKKIIQKLLKVMIL